MSMPRSRSLKRIAEAGILLGCIIAILLVVAPIFSNHPSKSAVRRWEVIHSPVLPQGYSDFRGHWQDQDVGVHIFSVRYPDGLDCEAILDGLVGRLKAYQVHQRVPGEIAFRQGVTESDPNGFNEYRFICAPEVHRVYIMFANLDSEMVVHPGLMGRLDRIASEKFD